MPTNPARRRAEDLRRWARGFPDATRLGELVPRGRFVAVGVVHKLRLVPGKSLEAVLVDGTGELTASWTGRTSIPGVFPGAALRLEGTVALDRGRARMRNPEYALLAAPYR